MSMVCVCLCVFGCLRCVCVFDCSICVSVIVCDCGMTICEYTVCYAIGFVCGACTHVCKCTPRRC